MKIKYLSHSCFEIRNEKTLLIDPYFSGNSLAPEYTGTPDLVLVTHEHFDHADASRFDTTVVCPPNLRFKKMVLMKIGEKKVVEGIEIEMIGASHHQSSYPTGFIFEFEKKRLCHLGDTYLDGVKKYSNIDILFVPIGGYYTMNQSEALEAVKLILPKLVIPMHYNTFPQIKSNPEEFKKKCEREGFKCTVIPIGEEVEV